MLRAPSSVLHTRIWGGSISNIVAKALIYLYD